MFTLLINGINNGQKMLKKISSLEGVVSRNKKNKKYKFHNNRVSI